MQRLAPTTVDAYCTVSLVLAQLQTYDLHLFIITRVLRTHLSHLNLRLIELMPATVQNSSVNTQDIAMELM